MPSAFVAALPDSFDRQGPSVAVWLARDYGLTFDFARLDRLEDVTEVPWRYAEVMRRLWPTSLDLAALTAESGPGLPLFGAQGHLVGHLATLDPRPHRRRDDARLEPLRRVAATNVERWAASL